MDSNNGTFYNYYFNLFNNNSKFINMDICLNVEVVSNEYDDIYVNYYSMGNLLLDSSENIDLSFINNKYDTVELFFETNVFKPVFSDISKNVFFYEKEYEKIYNITEDNFEKHYPIAKKVDLSMIDLTKNNTTDISINLFEEHTITLSNDDPKFYETTIYVYETNYYSFNFSMRIPNYDKEKGRIKAFIIINDEMYLFNTGYNTTELLQSRTPLILFETGKTYSIKFIIDNYYYGESYWKVWWGNEILFGNNENSLFDTSMVGSWNSNLNGVSVEFQYK